MTVNSSNQYHIDFKAAFEPVRTFIVANYNKSFVWIKTGGSWVYAKLADISALAKVHLVQSYQAGKTFVLTQKQWVIGGAVICVALAILHYVWKNRPQVETKPKPIPTPTAAVIEPEILKEEEKKEVAQTPIIKMETTLNIAKLSVAIPKEKWTPPNVSLTFCIDLSGSMLGEREAAVKEAVNKVLDSAQKVVNASKEAQIGIAIVGFNQEAKVITPAVKLLANDESSLEKIKQQVAAMHSDGGTKISHGLESATQELERMATENPASTPTLILLTDGQDTVYSQQLNSLHARFAAAKVNLYAIGIGQHHKETLQEIATDSSKGFSGTYIDTTLGLDTIESAIAKIYNRALASYRDLVLSSPQLGENTWDLVGLPAPHFVENGQQKLHLGHISEDKQFQRVIRIKTDQLRAPLELSSVIFELTYKDPKGCLGKLSMPWNPNTTIDPAIATAASKG